MTNFAVLRAIIAGLAPIVSAWKRSSGTRNFVHIQVYESSQLENPIHCEHIRLPAKSFEDTFVHITYALNFLVIISYALLARVCYMYVMAKEGIAFCKYPVLQELEARHGVDLGQSFKTKDSAENFMHYIVENQRQQFICSLDQFL